MELQQLQGVQDQHIDLHEDDCTIEVHKLTCASLEEIVAMLYNPEILDPHTQLILADIDNFILSYPMIMLSVFTGGLSFDFMELESTELLRSLNETGKIVAFWTNRPNSGILSFLVHTKRLQKEITAHFETPPTFFYNLGKQKDTPDFASPQWEKLALLLSTNIVDERLQILMMGDTPHRAKFIPGEDTLNTYRNVHRLLQYYRISCSEITILDLELAG